MRVAVIGGGIAGLAAAYELAKLGYSVDLFEAAPEPGGQAAIFNLGGARVERFYHHIFRSDTDLIELLDELGLIGRLRWIPSKVGFFHRGSIYDFVTPWDLLRFTPLSLADRVRLGLLALYLQRYTRWQNFEGITAREWILKYAGQRIYEVVWGPLLREKFGQGHAEVGMVWFWGKIHLRFASRGRTMQREVLGYLDGSFGLLLDTLAERITALGGSIHLDAPVTRIIVEESRMVAMEVSSGAKTHMHPCDAVVATVPSPVFDRLVPELPAPYREKLRQARYQAALCLVLVLKEPLSHIYWLNISDPTIPFVGAIEHTNFVDRAHYGGRVILYLSNYVAPGSPLYDITAEELLALYTEPLRRINPHFQPSWVEECHLFKEAAAQPLITTHYSSRIPEARTPISGLYLANTTQIYPEDRGMNYSLRLGRKVGRLLHTDLVESL